MCFIIHFYTIFGTNLLTGGPVQIAVFFAYFSVSKKRIIKRSPNIVKPSRELFLEQTQSRRLGVDVKEATRWRRGREARPPPSWPPRLLLDFHSKSYGSCSFQKSHFEGFIPFGLRLIFLFYETLK